MRILGKGFIRKAGRQETKRTVLGTVSEIGHFVRERFALGAAKFRMVASPESLRLRSPGRGWSLRQALDLSESRDGERAFTVIELLVVIAVIAMLATLLIGVLPGVLQKRTISRVNAEMAAL